MPYRSGITFTGKHVLEGAVVLLGASIDLPALLKAGPTLLLAIVVVVTVGISASTLIGRMAAPASESGHPDSGRQLYLRELGHGSYGTGY